MCKIQITITKSKDNDKTYNRFYKKINKEYGIGINENTSYYDTKKKLIEKLNERSDEELISEKINLKYKPESVDFSFSYLTSVFATMISIVSIAFSIFVSANNSSLKAEEILFLTQEVLNIGSGLILILTALYILSVLLKVINRKSKKYDEFKLYCIEDVLDEKENSNE